MLVQRAQVKIFKKVREKKLKVPRNIDTLLKSLLFNKNEFPSIDNESYCY